MIRYDTIRKQNDTIRKQNDTIRYNIIQLVCIDVRYDTIRYDTLLYDLIQYTIRLKCMYICQSWLKWDADWVTFRIYAVMISAYTTELTLCSFVQCYNELLWKYRQYKPTTSLTKLIYVYCLHNFSLWNWLPVVKHAFQST